MIYQANGAAVLAPFIRREEILTCLDGHQVAVAKIDLYAGAVARYTDFLWNPKNRAERPPDGVDVPAADCCCAICGQPWLLMFPRMEGGETVHVHVGGAWRPPLPGERSPLVSATADKARAKAPDVETIREGTERAVHEIARRRAGGRRR